MVRLVRFEGRVGVILVALLGMVLLAACAGIETEGARQPSAGEMVDVVKEVEKPAGSLTIYSGRSEKLVDPIILQFSQVTGVKVSKKYAGTSQLAATLLEEGDRTPADVFLAQDPGVLGAVKHLLAPLPQRILSRVPEWARSPEGRWVGISGRVRVVVYNTQKLQETDLPDDLGGFIDPKWKGRIGWAPTNASFQTMVTGMRTLWGEEKTRRWLEGIKANEAKIYPKNTPIVQAVGAGEIDVGFVNHYYLLRFLQEQGETFAARNYHLRAGGPGSLIMVSGAGILAASNNREAAEKFLAFMLSTVGQQYFAGQTFEYPLVEGVQTQPELVPLSQVRRPNIPLKDLATSRARNDFSEKPECSRNRGGGSSPGGSSGGGGPSGKAPAAGFHLGPCGLRGGGNGSPPGLSHAENLWLGYRSVGPPLQTPHSGDPYPFSGAGGSGHVRLYLSCGAAGVAHRKDRPAL